MFYSENKPPPLNLAKLDDDVLAEMHHVEAVDKGRGVHSLVVNKISKYFGSYLAVNRVSFSKYYVLQVTNVPRAGWYTYYFFFFLIVFIIA